MARLLTIISLILALVLFPPAALAVISNNAIPGDSTYPIKRSLEDVIFAVASVNPVTKAWFAAARSDRRFTEFKTLIAQGKKGAETLNELVEQTNIAASQIAQVTDPAEKAKLIEQLSQSIEKYDQGLKQISDSTTPQVTTLPVATSQPTPRPTAVSGNTPVLTAIVRATPVSTLAPQHTPIPAVNQNQDDDKEKKAIDDARKSFEEAKRRIHQQSGEERKEKVEKKTDDKPKDEDKSKEKGKSGKEK